MASKKKQMLFTSLSRREPAATIPVPENGNDSGIGCMSGIFYFLSRHHHSHSRKRLPSAGRKNKPVISQPKETPQTPEKRTATSPPEITGQEAMQPRSTHAIVPQKTFCVKESRGQSCEVQRSPTLSSEIRRSSSVDLSLDSPRRPSPLVVRLMGLDEIPVSSPDSAAEKRRKLLGALEKCNEDLKSLKRIIDAVQVADKRRRLAEKKEVVENGKVGDVEDGDSSIETVKSVDSPNGEQPSPVSVLQSISSPAHHRFKTNEEEENSKAAAIQLTAPEPSRLSIAEDFAMKKAVTRQSYATVFDQVTIERLPEMPKRREHKIIEEFGCAKKQQRRWECKRSQALVESVSEVWEDGVWEQRWELGRVAVTIERGICGELVDEFVRELTACCFLKRLISQGTCRRSLCF